MFFTKIIIGDGVIVPTRLYQEAWKVSPTNFDVLYRVLWVISFRL